MSVVWDGRSKRRGCPSRSLAFESLITGKEYAERIARALMAQMDLDMLLLASGPNLFYFSGFLYGRNSSRPCILLLPRSGEPALIVHQVREYKAHAFTGLGGCRGFQDFSILKPLRPPAEEFIDKI